MLSSFGFCLFFVLFSFFSFTKKSVRLLILMELMVFLVFLHIIMDYFYFSNSVVMFLLSLMLVLDSVLGASLFVSSSKDNGIDFHFFSF